MNHGQPGQTSLNLEGGHQAGWQFVGTAEIAAWSIGAGDLTAVFIHGFGEASHVWHDISMDCLPNGRVIIVDLPGHGQSAWHADGQYSVDRHVGDVMNLLKRLKLPHFALVGHSMGGAISLRIAARAPAGLAGLVLADYGPTPTPHGVAQLREDFERGNRVFTTREEYCALLASMRPLVKPDRLAMFAHHALRCREAGGFELRRDPAMLRPAGPAPGQGHLELLAIIGCPVLIVRGAFSAILSAATADAMARTAPRGQMATVPMAGHGLIADNPAGFVARVAPFLAGLGAPSSVMPGPSADEG
jgi:pimeloyl-ACP methyl ester carboxylesterase